MNVIKESINQNIFKQVGQRILFNYNNVKRQANIISYSWDAQNGLSFATTYYGNIKEQQIITFY